MVDDDYIFNPLKKMSHLIDYIDEYSDEEDVEEGDLPDMSWLCPQVRLKEDEPMTIDQQEVVRHEAASEFENLQQATPALYKVSLNLLDETTFQEDMDTESRGSKRRRHEPEDVLTAAKIVRYQCIEDVTADINNKPDPSAEVDTDDSDVKGRLAEQSTGLDAIRQEDGGEAKGWIIESDSGKPSTTMMSQQAQENSLTLKICEKNFKCVI